MKCSVKGCEEDAVYFGGVGNRFCRQHAVEKHLIRDDLIMVITKTTKEHPMGEMQLIRVSEEKGKG